MGVIGHPIGQTLSPVLHDRWAKALGITAQYHPVDGQDQFADIVAACAAKGWFGLNVTIPFKAAALALADEATDVAKKVGAANLLQFSKGHILADNTDVAGFREAVAQSGWSLPRTRVLLVGAGGAAPAIVYALK
ncbi:MAG: shikimate dehydrogenase, partial [Pseudomonadota bacterium]